MSGVRWNYVVAIIFVHDEVIVCVTGKHDIMFLFFVKIDNQPWFWRGSISWLIYQSKACKKWICSILCKSHCRGYGKSYKQSTKKLWEFIFLLQKGVRQFYNKTHINHLLLSQSWQSWLSGIITPNHPPPLLIPFISIPPSRSASPTLYQWHVVLWGDTSQL